MKRARSDDELRATARQLLTSAGSFDALPPDVVLQILMSSGLSVPEMRRMCNISKAFSRLCTERRFWDRLFAKLFVPEGQPYYNHWAFLKWKRDAKNMPDEYARLMAFKMAYDSRLCVKMTDRDGSSVVVTRCKTKTFTVFVPGVYSSKAAVRATKRIDRMARAVFPKKVAFLEFYTKDAEQDPPAIAVTYSVVTQFENVLYRLLYAMLVDGWTAIDTRCASCAEIATRVCGACRRVKYCSKQCQSDDWRQHSLLCEK